jgi:hypothetical protein
MNVPQMIELLKAANHPCWLGMYTDEHGAAFLLQPTSLRTLRDWRRRGCGPGWDRTTRVRYDLEKLAAWLEAGGNKKNVAEVDG